MCSVIIHIWETAIMSISNFIQKRIDLLFDITDMFITMS